MGDSNSSSPIHWLDSSKLLLPNPELTTVLGAEDGVQESADLGEPECYYFEEYEAPRMNPSVVAATRGLDFSKSSTNGKGKPLRRCKSPWTRWSRSLLTTPRRLPAQEPHRASSFEPREGEDNTQRRRKTSKARRSSSTTGLDRVQTEETQLDRADGRADQEEPQFEDPGFEYDPMPYQEPPRSRWNPYGQYELPMLHQGQGSHTHFKMKKRRKRSHKLDRVSHKRQPQLHGVLLMAVSHLQTTT
ncbi:unnamed protein product [Microthlaspi erraticum]|uniref:Uncharacterized protein n=1 Tax=Microthlaspi erraticum TaxID=1685480 RepID=A0A6D2K2B4_9BRAS|nr:unnamed protein product [Microthlaspi erraticum]